MFFDAAFVIVDIVSQIELGGETHADQDLI